jgi:DNA-binding transcriptional ArsR family regulator
MERTSMESGDAGRIELQLPWETLNRFRERDEWLGTSSTLDWAALERRPRHGRSTSRATVEKKGGLTHGGILYQYIRAHPGAHVRGMANDLGFATGDLQYHLTWLERRGHVETMKNGFYRFVYPSMMFEERQKVVLGILSLETPREILLSLLQDACMAQLDLAKRLGYSQPTISWHMGRLVRQGILRKRRTSKGIAYEVLADRAELLQFVKEYHPAVWRRWARRLTVLTLSAGDAKAEGGKITRVGPIRPALVYLIGRN